VNKKSSFKPSDIKTENQTSILQYVFRNGETTIPALAESLGMSKPTVTALVDELVRRKYLKESGIGVSAVGKRPKLYDFHAGAGAVIALHFGVKALQCALFDLKLNLLKRNHLPVDNRDVAHTLEEVIREVGAMTAYAEARGIPVLGIGASIPGVIESRQGVLINAAHMERWQAVPIGAYLGEKLRLPVWADNESRNMAVAEKWFGCGKESNHFVTIQTKEGIGTGIIVNGNIYRGKDNSAGEFGHTTIDMNGPVCRCSNVGCWELYAEESAFLQRLVDSATADPNAAGEFKRRLAEGETPDYRLVEACSSRGDEWLRTQVQEYARMLAIGIVNIVNALNPEMIVLHGDIRHLGQPFLDTVTAIVRKRALVPSNHRVTFRFSSFVEDSKIIGAASLALKEIVGGALLGGADGKAGGASNAGS